MLEIKKAGEGVSSKLNLKKGCKILSFDGFEAVNYLDYIYYDSKDKFKLAVCDKAGVITEHNIRKKDYQSLNLEFSEPENKIKTCANKCIFCFIDQLPKNLRPSLYVKDDDVEMSFLCGNFVTLTNLTPDMLSRVARLKLSPLYISAHSTNPEIRVKMTGNKNAGNILSVIKLLAENEIEMYMQIVAVQGVNDGDFESTCNDLYKFYTYVKNCAIVPCGITKYREGLFPVKDIDKEFSLKVIEFTRRFNESKNVNFAFAADEFYIKAGLEQESFDYYDDFSQLENGVGMLAKFQDEVIENLNPKALKNKKSYLIVTGVSAYGYMRKICEIITDKIKNLTLHVIKCENDFFGHTVTCCGLLTGTDVINCIKNYGVGFDEVILPSSMLRHERDKFLDDVSVSEAENAIGKKINVCEINGKKFVKQVTNIK